MPSERVAALVARLEKGRDKTLAAFTALRPEQWSRLVYETPYPWDVRALLAHFVSSEEALLRLAQDVASGGPGAPSDMDYDAFNAQEQQRLKGQTTDELLSALAKARQATIDWVTGLDDSQLDRVGRHPALGEISVEMMITAMYGHQLLHMRDLQSRLGSQ